MKKKLFILIPILILLIVIIVVINRPKKDETKGVEEWTSYIYTTYRENGTDYACITFYDNDKYSLYDCDSEPTNYPFDSENECIYSFDNKAHIIYFDCKDEKKYEIKVLKWNEKEFSFEFEKQKKTFIAVEKNG